MNVLDAICQARQTRDPSALVAIIPYARWLGLTMTITQRDDVIGKLTFSEHLIGNASIPALHGGVLAALLESTAMFELVMTAETMTLPKTINATIEYLRSARPRDVFARASITRRGRRIASMRSIAWQDDPDRPIAAANVHFLLGPAVPADR